MIIFFSLENNLIKQNFSSTADRWQVGSFLNYDVVIIFNTLAWWCFVLTHFVFLASLGNPGKVFGT
jgi:hypothetical protein